MERTLSRTPSKAATGHVAQWLLMPLLVPEAFGGSFTHLVLDHPEACKEVNIPRWTLPPEVRKDELDANLKVRAGDCLYDLRTPDGTMLYVSVSCYCFANRNGCDVLEKYAVDLSHPKTVHKLEESAWQAASSSTNLVRGPMYGYRWKVTPDGVEIGDRLFKKAGPKWPLGGEGPYKSSGGTRIAVDSWDGSIGYPGPFDMGWPQIKGRYWTDIYDLRSGQRVIEIQGAFHGVEPYFFQLQARLVAEKFYVLPLQPKAMHRILVCDLDAAQPATTSSR